MELNILKTIGFRLNKTNVFSFGDDLLQDFNDIVDQETLNDVRIVIEEYHLFNINIYEEFAEVMPFDIAFFTLTVTLYHLMKSDKLSKEDYCIWRKFFYFKYKKYLRKIYSDNLVSMVYKSFLSMKNGKNKLY